MLCLKKLIVHPSFVILNLDISEIITCFMNVLYLDSKPNRIDQVITVVLIIALVLDLLALHKVATCTMFKHKYVLLSSFTLWYFLQEIMRL